MRAQTFRRLALEASGAVEAGHMGHPDFRLCGRIFASLPIEEDFGVVNLTPEAQEELIARYPAQFEPLAGSWGEQGWTRVRFPAARAGPVREALRAACEKVTAGKRGRGARPPRHR